MTLHELIIGAVFQHPRKMIPDWHRDTENHCSHDLSAEHLPHLVARRYGVFHLKPMLDPSCQLRKFLLKNILPKWYLNVTTFHWNWWNIGNNAFVKRHFSTRKCFTSNSSNSCVLNVVSRAITWLFSQGKAELMLLTVRNNHFASSLFCV